MKLDITHLSTKEYLYAFSRIPLETNILDLSRNTLCQKSTEELAIIFSTIPKQVKTLKLCDNGLRYKTGEDLATVFSAIPSHVETLDLRWNGLGHLATEELTSVFAAIPPHVKTLNLSKNNLDQRTAEELATAFSALPEQMKTLVLGGNGLCQKSTEELTMIFTSIPKQVETLDLSDNGLGYETGEELAAVFDAIPEQVKTLKLRKNGIYNLSAEEFRHAFSSLPETITTLDLSHNALSELPLSSLLALLQALLQSNTCVDLSYNELFTHCTLPQRDELLQALGPLRENGRLNLAHNGESEGSRAFLPLKTLAQKHAAPDLVRDHILSFLTPMQESKISTQRHKLDDKLAKQSDVNLAQQNLLACIKTLIAQDSFWENKVRFPDQTTRKRPYGIQRMESLLKNFERNPAQCCHEIIASSSARHCKYWQWAHPFFRGRDNTTNTIYGILKEVVITNAKSIEAAINALNQLQTAHTEKVPQCFANQR